MLTKILTKKNSKIAIVITAAGSSTRMGSGIKKEYLPLNNGTVLSNCALNFLTTLKDQSNITDFIITYPKGGLEQSKKALFRDTTITDNTIQFVEGNTTRQSSVFNALKAIKENNKNPEIVLIHDGARPFVTSKIITDVLNAALEYGASVPGVTPTDTQKELDENGFIIRHLVRNSLAAVQTPQGFNFEKLYEAHVKASKENKEYTDDTEVWGKYVGQVKVVPGDIVNKKITYPGDS